MTPKSTGQRVADPTAWLVEWLGPATPLRDALCIIEAMQPPEVRALWELIERQKSAPLPADEKSELDHYLEIEHLMRLAKARARQLLAHAQ